MLGTIVNTCTILIGGMVGSILGTGIKEKYKKVLFDALGLCCLVLGINAALPNMAKSEYPVMFIASLAIGSVIGTRLDLHFARLQKPLFMKQKYLSNLNKIVRSYYFTITKTKIYEEINRKHHSRHQHYHNDQLMQTA